MKWHRIDWNPPTHDNFFEEGNFLGGKCLVKARPQFTTVDGST